MVALLPQQIPRQLVSRLAEEGTEQLSTALEFSLLSMGGTLRPWPRELEDCFRLLPISRDFRGEWCEREPAQRQES